AAVVTNLERVLAIELMTAFQAMEFLRPLRSSATLERVRGEFRRVVKAWDRDRELHPDLERARAFLESDAMERAIRPLSCVSDPDARPGTPRYRPRDELHGRRRPPNDPGRARIHPALPRLDPGGRAADAREQPRSGGRRAPRRADRLRRDRPRRAQLGG